MLWKLGNIHQTFHNSLCCNHSATLQVTSIETAEFANSIEPDEVAHNEPPHLDLHCLLSSL